MLFVVHKKFYPFFGVNRPLLAVEEPVLGEFVNSPDAAGSSSAEPAPPGLIFRAGRMKSPVGRGNVLEVENPRDWNKSRQAGFTPIYKALKKKVFGYCGFGNIGATGGRTHFLQFSGQVLGSFCGCETRGRTLSMTKKVSGPIRLMATTISLV